MSYVSLLSRLFSSRRSVSKSRRPMLERSPSRFVTDMPVLVAATTHTLTLLPFDILLRIAHYLEPEEILALGMTCRHLKKFSQSRAIWLTMAIDMLELCRPLPLPGFKTISDMATSDLSRLVRTGLRQHRNWTTDGSSPRLILPHALIFAPREEIVWLSPITTNYLLCCTEKGRVMCWDLSRNTCIAELSCGEDWEIWKCRVEYEERTVYLAMAKRGADKISADCQLLSLKFPTIEGMRPPKFKTLSTFTFPRHVVSVYLLDPLRRILSAYIWIESTNQLGLYMLLDWSIPLYVYINTGISFDLQTCVFSSIGYDPENVVIHAEEETRAVQSFYPYSFLQEYSSRTPPKGLNPPLVLPPRTHEAAFLPTENPFAGKYQIQTQNVHFVRQWWPLVPNAQRLTRRSCTILLQAMNVALPGPDDPPPAPGDPPPGVKLFTIAQHYFSVPLSQEKLRWWYTNEPFEIVCYPQPPDDDDDDHPEIDEDGVPDMDWLDLWNEIGTAGAGGGNGQVAGAEGDAGHGMPVSRSPLIAVDFGCAVWLEYSSFNSDEIRVRYVIFPSVDIDRSAPGYDGLSSPGAIHTLEVHPGINLKRVCHIGVDQAQGTVILAAQSGAIHVMRFS